VSFLQPSWLPADLGTQCNWSLSHSDFETIHVLLEVFQLGCTLASLCFCSGLCGSQRQRVRGQTDKVASSIEVEMALHSCFPNRVTRNTNVQWDANRGSERKKRTLKLNEFGNPTKPWRMVLCILGTLRNPWILSDEFPFCCVVRTRQIYLLTDPLSSWVLICGTLYSFYLRLGCSSTQCSHSSLPNPILSRRSKEDCFRCYFYCLVIQFCSVKSESVWLVRLKLKRYYQISGSFLKAQSLHSYFLTAVPSESSWEESFSWRCQVSFS
jgi:hypothetical protein